MKITSIKNMMIALLAICILWLAVAPVAAQGDVSVAKNSPSDSLPEDITPSSGSLDGSAWDNGQTSSSLPGSSLSEDDSEDGAIIPFAAGDAVITVSGVAAGGLQAAVTAANGGSSDFSALLELNVTSGTLTTTDFFFLATLPAVQILDMTGCGVVDGSLNSTGLLANRINLISVNMPAANPYFMGNSMFMGCTSLVSVNVSKAYGFGSSFFQGCTSLQNVILPSIAYSVSTSMFMGCTALTAIDLSAAVTIDNNAFTNCTALRSVNMGGANKTIYSYVFFNCSSLVDVTLPTSCTIGSGSFSQCPSLTNIDLSGARLTGDSVFFGDTALQNISIPADGVLPAYTYGNCTALTSVDVSAATSLGTGLFSGCTNIQDVVLPASYVLPESMFQNCVSLREIDLRGATSFGTSALGGCLRLTDVAMPQRYLPIASSMFTGCESLERIDLTYATGFGAFAFNSCYHLYDITWPAAAPPDTALGMYAFALTAQDFTKGFPPGSGLTAGNVARIAPSQRPRVYFSLPSGTSGTITQGDAFSDPWALQTQFGTSYTELCADPSYVAWRVYGLQPPAVTVAAALNGVPVAGIDTSVPGTYTIHYSIPTEVFADNHELEYTLTVVPAGTPSTPPSSSSPASSSPSSLPNGSSEPMSSFSGSNTISSRATSESSSSDEPGRFDGLPDGPIYVGDEFTIIPIIAEEMRREGWGWDSELLDGEPQAGGAHFRAVKPGCACIWYTLRNGERIEVVIVVRERQTCWCVCVLLIILFLLILALLLWLLWRKRRRQDVEEIEEESNRDFENGAGNEPDESNLDNKARDGPDRNGRQEKDIAPEKTAKEIPPRPEG